MKDKYAAVFLNWTLDAVHIEVFVIRVDTPTSMLAQCF